jgi:biofilm PGA synthesis lipoprotein PgaB
MLKIFKINILFLIFSFSYLIANDLPNECSRDKNINEFTILSYHEIIEKSKMLDSTYAVTPYNFEKQIKWLIDNDYHFVNVDDILDYRNHGIPLANKAILITFDDGYSSVYENAFPILKKYKIPFVVALVGKWENSKNKVDYSGEIVNRDMFLNKNQIKEMQKSGLIEIASHTYDLHHGIIGNPQTNKEPAMTTRGWNIEKENYETEENYKKRIYKDSLKNSVFLTKYTGQKPRIIVYPYGNYNKEVRQISDKLGMTIGLTLDDGSNTKSTPLWDLRRILVEKDMTIKSLENEMWVRNKNFTDDNVVTKSVHIDLDDIYDQNSTQQSQNIDILIEKIQKLGVNTVYLKAFSDKDNTGIADSVYFYNTIMPVKSDIFNFIAWTITSKTDVRRVYAWLPLLSWKLPEGIADSKNNIVIENNISEKLSPFSPFSKNIIKGIYSDLSKHAYFDGILFDEDIMLSENEDDSEFAHKQYKKWRLPENIEKIKEDKKQYKEWAKLKTKYLDNFAFELYSIVKEEQPGIAVARKLYPQITLNKDAEELYSQSLSDSIKNYDYTEIIYIPCIDQTRDKIKYYENLINKIKKEQCGLDKTVIELQNINFQKDNEELNAIELNNTIKYLYNNGINHIAYYPSNLINKKDDSYELKENFCKKDNRVHIKKILNFKINKS